MSVRDLGLRVPARRDILDHRLDGVSRSRSRARLACQALVMPVYGIAPIPEPQNWSLKTCCDSRPDLAAFEGFSVPQNRPGTDMAHALGVRLWLEPAVPATARNLPLNLREPTLKFEFPLSRIFVSCTSDSRLARRTA